MIDSHIGMIFEIIFCFCLFEDAGTEIAVVLDGSGSIEPEDFERAKNFIHTLMKNVWRTCFNVSTASTRPSTEIIN